MRPHQPGHVFLGANLPQVDDSRGGGRSEVETINCELKGGFAFLLILLLLFTAVPSVRAVPPTNDVCSGAEVIPVGAFPVWTTIKSMAEATTVGDPPLPSCAFGNAFSHSLWYLFTPNATAFYTISSCADAPTATQVPDTFMAIYTSSGGCDGATNELESTASSVGCADDSCGPGFTQAAITTRLLSDSTYYIVVWWYDGSAPPANQSSLQLRVTQSSPPVNDTCESALPLVLNYPVVGTTIGANNDYELSNSPCFLGIGNLSNVVTIGRDIVYYFVAPQTANYSFKVLNYDRGTDDRPQDLVLYLTDSCPLGAEPRVVTNCLAAANRNAASRAEEIVCYAMTSGQKVYLFVDDTNNLLGSSFTLEVTKCIQEIEPNGNWTNNAPNLIFASGIEGTIQSGSDVDFYPLGAPPAGWRVFAMVDGSAANVPTLDLRLVTFATNAAYLLEYDSGNNDPLFGDSSSNLAGTPLNGLPAFLRISSSGLPKEPYRVYAVAQPPLETATVETEPNDSREQPNPLAGNNYFYGNLAGPSPSTDVDVYPFSVETPDGFGDLIFVSLDADPLRNNTPINARLELLDEAGNVLVVVDDSASTSTTTLTTNLLTATTPNSPGEALVYRTMQDGIYYARVSISSKATGLAAAGDYLLSISRNGFTGCCGANTAPKFGNLTVTSPIGQDGLATVTAAFFDPDAGQSHTLVIDWGDNSPSTTANCVPWTNTCALSHEYLSAGSSNSYLLTLTLSDSFGGVNSTNIMAAVAHVAPELKVITPWVDGHVLLQLHGGPNTAYLIETSGTLAGWSTFTNRITDATGFFQVEDATSPSPQRRFYRARTP